MVPRGKRAVDMYLEQLVVEQSPNTGAKQKEYIPLQQLNEMRGED